ncbi:ABC transporter ATP-binding protein [Paenibacillus glycanilyticus]|uniref:ABC transporter ATP-binding protein n=1 Tax=Paenibacillus glycanilyticus TaxID=126569 RepID=UPI002040C17D|nr:ABC transporter ATP-binding protein [Paenibacillus glycanilyticus]MCM3626281.1 ABC transporter ATP-binding protein [Paenibacillus glycanilyticus]
MQVRLEQLTKAFESRKNDKVIAVNKLDLTIESGKLIGLLGPSGCGKSTTLFMVAGIHDVTDGKIYFDDQDVTELSADKRGIGLVFQNYALYPHLSVWDNIAFPLLNSKDIKKRLKKQFAEQHSNYKNYKAYISKLVEDAAKLVEITAYLDRKPGELSGGQQQRVAIARAIVKSPSILLMDEPLSNLDARLRIQTRDEIKRIQQQTGITTIMVTHDQEEALAISDEVIVLKEGVLQQQGLPQDVYDNPANQFVAEFISRSQINMVRGKIAANKLYLGEEEWFPLPAPLMDQEVMIGLRYENIKPAMENMEHSFTASVTARTRIGGMSTVQVRLTDGQQITLHNNEEESLRESERLQFVVKPQTVLVFNQKGEKLLQC